MKKHNPNLGRVIGIVIVLLITVLGVNKLFDPIYFPLLWIVSIIWDIYLKLQLKRESSDQLRIPTYNDDSYRILPFIFGVLLTIGGFFALIYLEWDNMFWSLIIFTGILLLISGALFVPSGIIEIKSNELTFVNGEQVKSIEIEKLNNIELKPSDIIFTDNNQEKYYVNHFKLEESDFQKISDFIYVKLKNKIEIKTYGNN